MPAEIELTIGTLPPPACYASEQERADAYVAAMMATLVTTDEWYSGQNPPTDTDLYWLQLDVDGRPVMAYYYFADDAAWVPWFAFPVFRVATGAAGAYSITNSPAMTTVGEAYQVGRTYVFKANHASTGATSLNVDGLGAKDIKVKVTQDTVADSIKIDQIVTAVYDGINFQIVSAVGGSSIEASDIVAGDDGDTLRTRDISGALTTVWEKDWYKTAAGDEEALPAQGASVAFTHGLTVNGGAVVPNAFGARLVCTAVDVGYAIGDECNLPSAWDTDGDRRNQWFVWANNLTVNVIWVVGNGTEIFVPIKTTGVTAAIDNSKWKLVAWATI